MRKPLLVTSFFLALLISFLVLRPVHGSAKNIGNSANDAAFRDGAYLGHLAADRGEAPHISFGRWAAEQDRKSFTFGYEEAYLKHFTDNAANSRATDAAYRDGLYQGRLDAQDTRPVHISSGRWSQQKDRSSFSQGYKQAYAAVAEMHGKYDQSVREALLEQ